MIWRTLLADIIVVAHAAYFSFVVLGFMAIVAGIAFRWKWVRNRWFRWIHLSMIGIVVAEEIARIPCPLTVWERQLRTGAGQVAYAGDFIGYWTHRLLFFHFERWVLTAVYGVFGLAVLTVFILAPPRSKSRSLVAPGNAQ